MEPASAKGCEVVKSTTGGREEVLEHCISDKDTAFSIRTCHKINLFVLRNRVPSLSVPLIPPMST